MIWRRERDSRLGRRRGLVRRIANKPPHSGHRSRLTYALTHLTMRKQWISTVCRTALFVGKQRVSAVLSSVESSDLRRQSLLASPRIPHSLRKKYPAERQKASRRDMAQREGFEPPYVFPRNTISRLFKPKMAQKCPFLYIFKDDSKMLPSFFIALNLLCQIVRLPQFHKLT